MFRARIFRRDPKARAPGGLTVIYGDCEHCAADYAINRQGFPYWCIEFVVSGSGEVKVAGKPAQILEPGTVFTYGPVTVYRMSCDPARPLVKYFADFTGRRGLSLLRETNLLPGTCATIFPPNTVADAFDRLIDTGLDTAPRAPRRLALILESLLLGCADHRVPQGATQSEVYTTYRRCRDVIDGLDRTGPVIRSTSAAARACNINGSYLCRLFRSYAGVAPHQYRTRLRMQAATTRLSEPGRMVKEVAEEFGFADPYHFSRVFKRFTALPPPPLPQGGKNRGAPVVFWEKH